LAARKLSEIAAKARRDPYELDLEDKGEPVIVPQPAIDEWQEALQAPDLPALLTAMGVDPDDVARVRKAVGALPLGSAGELVADMRRHFGLGN
jgi:hypothetical protein